MMNKEKKENGSLLNQVLPAAMSLGTTSVHSCEFISLIHFLLWLTGLQSAVSKWLIKLLQAKLFAAVDSSAPQG